MRAKRSGQNANQVDGKDGAAEDALPTNVDREAYRDLNLLLAPFVDHLSKSDESVPQAVEELMDKFTAMVGATCVLRILLFPISLS